MYLLRAPHFERRFSLGHSFITLIGIAVATDVSLALLDPKDSYNRVFNWLPVFVFPI